MSNHRGTIKHAAHVSCKSRIHTSRADTERRPGETDGCPTAPNFLLRPMGSKNLMRLSLKKGAHADLSRAACRKFGVFATAYSGLPVELAGFGTPQAAERTAMSPEGTAE